MRALQIEAAAYLYSSKVTTSNPMINMIGTGRKCSDISNSPSTASTKVGSHDSGRMLNSNNSSSGLTNNSFSYPKLLINPNVIEKLSGGKAASIKFYFVYSH